MKYAAFPKQLQVTETETTRKPVPLWGHRELFFPTKILLLSWWNTNQEITSSSPTQTFPIATGVHAGICYFQTQAESNYRRAITGLHFLYVVKYS